MLPLFVDGELDASLMQAVAAHGAQCSDCDGELQRFERLQVVLRQHIESRLATVNVGDLWSHIQAQLPARVTKIPWWKRWPSAATEWSWQPQVLWPAVAVFALAVAATLLLLGGQQHSVPRGPATMVADLEPSAWIDSLEADAGSVAVMDDWQHHTTVLWVSDEIPGAGGIEP